MTRFLTVSAAAICMLVAPALAQDISTKAVYDCAAKTDDAARLACYDDAVGRLKTAEEAGEITTITKTDIENVRRDSFGFSIPSLPKIAMPKIGGDGAGEDLNEIILPVKSVSRDARGRLIVRLENGQVWLQVDTTPVKVSKKRGVEQAKIKRASLGSFRMKLDKGLTFRARRER